MYNNTMRVIQASPGGGQKGPYRVIHAYGVIHNLTVS